MQISKDVFFFSNAPTLVVWNFRTHKQFSLDHEYQIRLMALIADVSVYDAHLQIDKDFLAAGILVDKNALEDWGWDVLSRIYHYGTKNVPCEDAPEDLVSWSSSYKTHCECALGRPYPEDPEFLSIGRSIPLPEPSSLLKSDSLQGVLLNRKTCRVFNSLPCSLEQVNTVLNYSLRYLLERSAAVDCAVPEGFRNRRTSPSGGGLNCIDGYIYIKSCVGLNAGVYRYDCSAHTLHFASEDKYRLGELLAGQHFINDLGFGIFLVARFDKLWWKYKHSRAYRMALVEVGHISQTIQLVSTALGLGTWLTGALNESLIEKFLALSSQQEVLFFVGAGYTTGEDVPKVLK